MKDNILLRIAKPTIDAKWGPSGMNSEEWNAAGKILTRLFEKHSPNIYAQAVPYILENFESVQDGEYVDEEWWESVASDDRHPNFHVTESEFIIYHSRSEMEGYALRAVSDEEWVALLTAINDLYASFFFFEDQSYFGVDLQGVLWRVPGELNGVAEQLDLLGQESEVADNGSYGFSDLEQMVKAAELGSSEAMEWLGNYYRRELYDLEQAENWFSKAANLGNASAANTLIYAILIPRKDWDSVDRFVQLAVATDTENQSTNAISNGAIAKYLQGNVEEAIEGFNLALSRDDHFADSEASWWLAMIYDELGNVDLESKYAQICFDSGGYEIPTLAPRYKNIVNVDAQYPVNVTSTLDGRTLGSFMKYVSSAQEVITPMFNGFFNIESGMVGIAGEQLAYCDSCTGIPSSGITLNCSECGRTDSNYMALRSGVGDGVYANYDLYWDSACAGSLVVLDEGSAFSESLGGIFEAIRDSGENFGAPTSELWEYLENADQNLEMHFCGSMSTAHDSRWSPNTSPYGSLFFGDAGEGLDSLNAVVYNKNFPVGEHKVYVFASRDLDGQGALIPRFLVTMRAILAKKLGMPDESNPTTDWLEEGTKWNTSLVASSIGGSLGVAAARLNTVAKLAKLSDPSLDHLSRTDYEVLAYGWMMHQHINGSLADEVLQVLYQVPQRNIQMAMRMVGLETEAAKITEWPPTD